MPLRKIRRLWVLFPLIAWLAFGACSPKPELATPSIPGQPGRAATSPGLNVCGSSQAWATGFQADQCLMADQTLPPVTPTFWPDACTPPAFGWIPSQSSFDQLSWRSFLYAVWPANPSQPGTPDTRQP